MKEDKTIAESINDKLAFSFTKDVLIKPLEITKVKKLKNKMPEILDSSLAIRDIIDLDMSAIKL